MCFLPVAVHVEQQVGGTEGHGQLVPVPVRQAVREHLRPCLPPEAVVEPELIPQATALQLKIAAGKHQQESVPLVDTITVSGTILYNWLDFFKWTPQAKEVTRRGSVAN